MDKAVLVMDMPKNCFKCKLNLILGMGGMVRCGANYKCCEKDFQERRPDWCQLKQIDPNLIKALRCLASQDSFGGCYCNKYNSERGNNPKMSCKGILDTVPCPYSQDEYSTDMGSDECSKWLGELADMLEGK